MTRPTVIVDARALYSSGIGRYLRECLETMLLDERFGRIVLLGDPAEIRGFIATRSARVETRILSLPGGFYSPLMQTAWVKLRLQGAVRGDVAFFPHYDAPTLLPHPRSVVTVQDLTHFKLPELFSKWRRLMAGAVLQRVVRQASVVIVSSESTRRDLRERCLPRQVEVVPFGVGDFFLEHLGGREPATAAGVPSAPYLLFVGNRKPHKNLVVMVEALAILRRTNPDLRMVVAGSTFAGWSEVLERAKALGVMEAVDEVDSPSDEEIRALYTECAAFVMPSLYEGFGLPVLEAMACGAPVVSSDRASLPEVVGDAGILFEPTSAESLARAVQSVLSNPSLRSTLVAKGHARAGEYTWGRAATRVSDILYEAATR